MQKHRAEKSRNHSPRERVKKVVALLAFSKYCSFIGAQIHLLPRFYKIPLSYYKSNIYLNLAERVSVTYKQKRLDQYMYCGVDDSRGR